VQQTLNPLKMLFKKESRMIFGSLLFFIFVTSCAAKDLSQYGRVTFYGQDSKNFTFFVSEEYVRANRDSKPDKSNPRMTKAETELLLNLLERRSYCVNDQGKILYRITSKQEKIYDMTFAHLIEQNYNARPVTPVMYYGECLSRPLDKKEVIKHLVTETKAVIN
jgi:hypothetical protein